jgi:hypothetical protein
MAVSASQRALIAGRDPKPWRAFENQQRKALDGGAVDKESKSTGCGGCLIA